MIDSDAMLMRKQRKLVRRTMHVLGPNYAWSTDGYDKLKRWGFYIHSCIDTYSRYILWLQVGISNKNSKLILKYYLDAIKELDGNIILIMHVFNYNFFFNNF